MPTAGFNLGTHIPATVQKQAAEVRYWMSEEGQQEAKRIRQESEQRKAALFATRKAGKSLGYNSSSVFGGGSPDKNETGVILG